MLDVKISISILFLGLTIFDAQARTPVKNITDLYEIEGDWYVIAVVNLRNRLVLPSCWRVNIPKSNRTTFDGFSTFYDGISKTRIVKQFTGSKSKDFLYPDLFDISVIDDNVAQRGLQISLYNGYMYNYSIWEWESGSGKLFDSLIVRRDVILSKTDTESLKKTYPNLKLIENRVSDSCVSPKNIPKPTAPADDPFKLKNVWYISAYQAERTLGRIRCWIVNMKTSSQTIYTGTSAFLAGKNRDRKVVSFSAIQYGNWTHVPKFHIAINGITATMKIVLFPSYIHSYSYWVSYGNQTIFDYLVASTNPILSEEELRSLDVGHPGFTIINNTRSSYCRSRPMRLANQMYNSTNNANDSTLNDNNDDYDEGEDGNEDLGEIEMFTKDEPSPAQRPDIEIRIVFFFVLSCMYFLASPQ